MRVCYHVQTHHDPDQVTRLVRTLLSESPESIVHISHDRRGQPLDESTLVTLGDVIVTYTDGGYGDFSHVDRHLQAIAWLLENDVAADWMVNLTGQDYPVRPIAAIERELYESGADAFMEVHPGFGAGARWTPARVRSRYYFHHKRLRPLTPAWRDRLHRLQVVNFVQPAFRVHVAYGLTVGVRTRTPFSAEFPVWCGSAFMSLRRPVLEYVYDFARSRNDVMDHFRRTLSPVEAAFPTIIANAGHFRIVDDPRRYFDFRNSTFNHPKTLDRTDLPEIFATDAHFARKFDATADPGLFDVIDAHRAELAGREVMA